jgi:hypothetical protein
LLETALHLPARVFLACPLVFAGRRREHLHPVQHNKQPPSAADMSVFEALPPMSFQDDVLAGIAVPRIYGAFALCRREGSLVVGNRWFVDKVAVLVAQHREVNLYLLDSIEEVRAHGSECR